jgi:hypothetical protein
LTTRDLHLFEDRRTDRPLPTLRYADRFSLLPSKGNYSTQSAHFCTSSLPPQGITGTDDVELFGEPAISVPE